MGTIEDGIFEKKGTLRDFGIACTVQEDPQTGDIEYSSSDAVSVEVKATGGAPVAGAVGAQVDANVAVGFKRANAILFQASHCKASTTSNLADVASAVLNLYNEGQWPADLTVVTDVVSSAAATILISSGAGAHIELGVRGKLGQDKANLASADASFSVNSFSGMATRIVGEKGTTPLFKASGIKKYWLPWRDAEFKTRSAADGLEFSPLMPVDLLVAAPPIRAG